VTDYRFPGGVWAGHRLPPYHASIAAARLQCGNSKTILSKHITEREKLNNLEQAD